MKTKRILAAIAACAMSAAMLGMTVSAAGIDSDDDVISDDEIGDEIDLGDVEDETPAETEAPAEVAPVPSSPKTGNSPIALAVIPVALAAAAVVAKKAK